ncbi:histidine phosphatase family protein [Xanthobacter sp. TB0139]|uniref:histidine phosphatase family protein n=1 Tax=Xanthobacter sp. TB0139 TaxID=3459178 RepID=UPI004039FF44
MPTRVNSQWKSTALWRSAPHRVRFPSGESLQDIILRGADMLRKVVHNYPDGTLVLVGHDSINRALLIQLLDQPLSAYWKIAQGPCCINVLSLEGEKVQISAINSMQHLDGLS